MTERLEQRFKRGEYGIPDVVAEFAKLLDKRGAPCWPFLGKRYVESDLELHFHWRHRHDFPLHDYCAVLKCPERRPTGLEADDGALTDAKGGDARNCTGREMFAVYVSSPEFVDQPEGMVRSVRSVERLQPLNRCLHGRAGLSDLPLSTPGFIAVRFVGKEDRKLDPVRVAGRSADQRSDSRRCLCPDLRPQGVLAGGPVHLLLSDQNIWISFQELAYGGPEVFELLACEVQFIPIVHA